MGKTPLRGFVGKCVIWEMYDVLVQNASEAEIKIDAIGAPVPALRLRISAVLDTFQFLLVAYK